MASPENPEEQPTIIQTTDEKKKSGCSQGCKYGLIAGGVILVLLVVVGGIGAMFGGTSSSIQPTDQATTVITTTQNQYTTKPTTVITTQPSQSWTEADKKFIAYVSESADLIGPLAEEIGASADAMDINGVGQGGAKLRNTAIAANSLIEPLTVSSSLKVSKENYVRALQYFTTAGNSYALAADAYNSGGISEATTLLDSANKDINSGTYYVGQSRNSLPKI